MQGRRLRSFFSTKKKPTARGEEDGGMRPAVNNSLTFLLPLSPGATNYRGSCQEGLRLGGSQWSSRKVSVAVERVLDPY